MKLLRLNLLNIAGEGMGDGVARGDKYSKVIKTGGSGVLKKRVRLCEKPAK